MKKYGPVLAALGLQWGDEGKGKIVDILAPEYDFVVRANGGANAGHTIKFIRAGEEKKIVFHQLPSGMTNDHSLCLIGNGCVLDFRGLEAEIADFESLGIKVGGRLKISDRAHLVCGYHKLIDGFLESHKGQGKIGTTLRGIGPAYADRIYRHGLRAGELRDWAGFTAAYERSLGLVKQIWPLDDYDHQEELAYFKTVHERFAPLIEDTGRLLRRAVKAGQSVLLEGANGALLDIDHGSYPFVTSSGVVLAGLCAGCGLPPQAITSTLGILKAYTTRVGGGPFPTEQDNANGERLRTVGGEFGSTTGRKRRCGWFDAVIARYACELNGITSVNLTKLDVLSGWEEIKIATAYRLNGEEIDSPPATAADWEKLEPIYETWTGWQEDISAITTYSELPANCRAYVERIESLIGVPIDIVNTGPRREQVILRG